MPARNKRKSNVQSRSLSPPTQLPTPLPEEERIPPTRPLDDRLIDFDTPTPPPQHPTHLPPLDIEDDDDDILTRTYRSPPFREARLPDLQDHSPPPLPVPFRDQQHDVYADRPTSPVITSPDGHTRWPTYSSPNTRTSSRDPPIPMAYPTSSTTHTPSPSRRSLHSSSSQSPSTFHSLTRTLRSYVPSSIHIPIPSAAPSPPLVSRPVSFGRFSSDLSRTDPNSSLGLGLHRDPSTPSKVVSRQEFERDYEQEASEGDHYYPHGYRYAQGHYRYGQGHQHASGLARAMAENRPPGFHTPTFHKPGTTDLIEWARWDALGDRRFLILAYLAGLQIWDCSDLSAVSEVLNLNFDSADWRMVLGNGRGGSTRSQEEAMVVQVIHAALLPTPTEMGSGVRDLFGADRPLLGILMQMVHTDDDYDEQYDSSFVLYSLRNHQLVKRLPLSGSPSTFSSNDQFIVVGTISPPTLLVLSSTTFQTLYIIPSASLEPFLPLPHNSPTTTTSSSTSLAQSLSNVTLSNIQSPTTSSKHVPLSIDNTSSDTSGNHRRQYPHPVFALSHRLLAYASPSPSSSSSPSSNHHRLSSSSTLSNPNSSLPSSPSPFGLVGGSIGMVNMNLGKVTNMTQAELGQAALKVGETVLGGMKLLGGMAYGAARGRVSSGGGGRVSRGGENLAPGGRFVSRSAPEAVPAVDDKSDEVATRERRFSNTSSVSGYHVTAVAPSTKSSSTASNGYHITVIDLSPLLVSAAGKKNIETPSSVQPVKIDEFMSSRSQPIADLQFSADGTSLAVIQRDGYVVKIFKIRPVASVIFSFGPKLDHDTEMRKRWSDHHQQASNSVQMYTLRRGRTSAVVEGVDWSKDGRWFAIGTRKRTVHVFSVNPYGGKADIASHLEGRVRNVDAINYPLTELSPLIRLRSYKQSSTPDHPCAPLAFTFISPLDISQSPRLLPQPHSRTPSSPIIQSKQQQQRFQDVLLFDPADGVLSLRRLSLDKHFVREQGLGMVAAAASVQALGVTSISLPGMGGAGKLAGSPSRSGGGGKPSVVVDHHPVMELTAEESTVATWDLQRRTDWVEIKQPIVSPPRPGLLLRGGDWLAEAELTTCSNSRHVLPRSIYLSHQFSFHTLGEDYHALIRRHQFDICGEEIKVRKQIEISAYSSGGSGASAAAAFIEGGFSAPRDIRRISSSFDEPIASAISGSFDNSNLPAILPMYPNGIPGSKPKSFRNSIPIRTMAAGIGDGVSEGLGRIRREMHKVRSPQLLPRSDSSMSGPPVPLEFDEEDEDFQVRDDHHQGLQVPTTRHCDDEASSISRGTSREGGGTSAESTFSLSLDTPADTSIHHHQHQHQRLPIVDDSDVVGTVDEEIWSSNGWDQQDALAVDEAEQFDNISTVGYLDEEQQQQQQARPATAAAVIPAVLSSKRKARQRRK